MRSLCGHCAVTVWSLCGHCVVTVWSLCGHCVVTVWSLCGHCVVTVWSLCGHCAVTVWSLCGHCAVTVWSLCGHCAVIVWSLCGHYAVLVWSCSLHGMLTCSAFERVHVLEAAIRSVFSKVINTRIYNLWSFQRTKLLVSDSDGAVVLRCHLCACHHEVHTRQTDTSPLPLPNCSGTRKTHLVSWLSRVLSCG